MSKVRNIILSAGIITLGLMVPLVVTADSGLDAESFTIESEMTANTGEVFSSSFGHKLSSRDEDPGGGIIDPVGIFEFTIDTSVSTTCTNPGIYLSGVGPETTLTHGGTGIQTPINDGGLTQLTESGTWIIQGEFDSIGQSSQNPANSSCLVSVDRWDDETGTTDLSYAFSRASNLTHVDRIPNTVTNMSLMFYYASNFNQDISNWDVSSVTTMERMFYGAAYFNNGGEPLDWGNKTSEVKDMSHMFPYTRFNQDISNWDVSKVEDMSHMFASTLDFNNGGEPLDWGNKTSEVKDMSHMFYYASNFNQDISNWDVSSVTTMERMFSYTEKFNNGGVPLDWQDTSNVKNMSLMFYLSKAFDQDISNWDVSNVKDMTSMFQRAEAFNQDISNWDVSSVTTMGSMFYNNDKYNNGGVPLDWDTSNVENMENMFFRAESFNQDLSSWKVPKIPSKPTGFSELAPFGNDPAKQPQWGVS